MKILQVISYLYPAWSYGGPGKLVFELSQKLTDFGLPIVIFTTDAFSADRRRQEVDSMELKITGIKYFVFKNTSNLLAFRYKFFTPLFAFIGFVKYKNDINLIHIHEFFTLLTIYSFLFSKFFKKPYIISAHGTLDNFHLSNRPLIKQIFMILIGKKIIENAALLLAATKVETKEYKILGVKDRKILHIPNGINIDLFNKLPPRGNFRKKNNIPAKNKIILFLGRINKLKGLDLLISAFAKLKKTYMLKLVIIGSDDGYLLELKNLVNKFNLNKDVIFTGLLSGKEKREAYKDSDLFVYPSPAEGFSLAILEAAASGLPLVITTGCKFPEVEKYRVGVIVEAYAEDLYLGIKKMLDNRKFRLSAGDNAKIMVKKQYSITVMSKRLLNLYRKTIRGYHT